MSINLIIDSIIYQLQATGGISRIYSEILPRMCDIDDSLRITLLTNKEPRQALPDHPHILHQATPQIERYLRPRFMWKLFLPRAEEIVRRFWIGRGKGQIWSSTYYTAPKCWDGLKVVTVPDMIHERFADLFNTITDQRFREQKRHCVLSADAVICISETTRRDLQHFYEINSDKIWVVPLGYSNAFKRLTNLIDNVESPVSGRFLLYVGERNHYKNIKQLIHAYSLWRHRHEVNLVVVGRKWSPDEIKTLTGFGIIDQICLLNNINDEALRHLYNTAAAFVYPSLYEGFGIPLLEAMSCGCPVIASRIPSTIEVAGECPVYFDPAETDQLVNAFDVVLSEGRYSERTKAGLERVKQYSWDKTAAQTLEAYRAIS